MQIEAVQDLAGFRALSTSWDELARSSATSTLFQSHLWHQIWLESYLAPGETPYILTARRDGKLVGIAPLFLHLRTLNGMRERTLSFIGGENFASDFCDFIIPAEEEGVLEAFLAFLFERDHDWTLLELANFPGESPLFDRSVALLKGRSARMSVNVVAEAPTLLLFDEPAVRERLNKKNLRHAVNSLAKQAELRFVNLIEREDMLRELPTFFEQHHQRWSSAGKKSFFSEQQNRDFYRRIVEQLQPEGLVRFAKLTHGGRPIAYHFGFEQGGRFYYYKTTFAIEYGKRSPGQVLLKFLLEDALERKLREFDFTLGEESYKYRYANHIRVNMRVLVYRRLLSSAVARTRVLLGRVKRRIRAVKQADPMGQS